MNIAIISNGKAVNAAIFADLQTAQSFFASGVWPEADAVIELPEGYGIGDSYDAQTGKWTKAPTQEEPEPQPTLADRIATLENENKTLSAQLTAATNQLTIYEGCIIELAQTVYA